MPAKACLTCGALTTNGSYCHTHAPARVKLDAQWSRIRAAYLAEHPWCEWCGKRADTVDHKRPRAIGGAHAIDNLRAMCSACHIAKTAREPYVTRRDNIGPRRH